MAAPQTLQFTLPEVLVPFPWPRNLSKHYHECRAESSAWVKSLGLFDEEGLKSFDRWDFSLLASLGYSPREKEIVRLGCDLMDVVFVFDEHTDVTDGSGAEKLRELVMDAFRNPHKERPKGDRIGAMISDFWIRASNYVSPEASCLSHFIQAFDTYTAAVVREADDRSNGRCRNFEEYLLFRRESCGVFPTFALCEFGLDLPEEVYQHPRMAALREQGVDLIAICNDIGSYAMEKSRGLELHNFVEVVMTEQKLDLQGALDWLEGHAAGVVAAFLDNVAQMPSWGEDVDRRLKIYIDGIAQWVRGNDNWTFETTRYFGDKGLEIQKTRVVTVDLAACSKGCVKKSALPVVKRTYSLTIFIQLIWLFVCTYLLLTTYPGRFHMYYQAMLSSQYFV